MLKGGFALIAILYFILANLRERLVDLFLPAPPVDGSGGGPGPGAGDNGDIIAIVYDHGQTGIALLIIAGVLLLSIAAFAVAWRMHSFRISAEAVEVRNGVLFRHNRQARLDRIQGIHITRPFFARLFGAAKIELSVAGQDAKVDLAYLGSGQVDELRREILRRASGVQAAELKVGGDASATNSRPGQTDANGRPGQTDAYGQSDSNGQTGVNGQASQNPQYPQNAPAGLVNRRMHELLAPELDPREAAAASVVKITPLRLIGSLVLSEFTVFLILVVAALILSSTWVHHALILVLLLPSLLGSLGFYVRRFSKSARYSISASPDGVRIGFGLLTTSNDTLPPGRIHAIEVTQPILWRPFGWWMIRINRAGHASSHGSAGHHHTLLLPVGRAADVDKVLGLLLPGLTGAETRHLVVAGLSASHGAGFTDAPRRAIVLRPFSWRRTGYATTADAVLVRSGFFWRRLMVVPLARLQSLHVAQGPVRRMLNLAALHFNTIAGPVRASLGVIDGARAVAAFESLAAGALAAAAADSSHRWRSRRSGSPRPHCGRSRPRRRWWLRPRPQRHFPPQLTPKPTPLPTPHRCRRLRCRQSPHHYSEQDDTYDPRTALRPARHRHHRCGPRRPCARRRARWCRARHRGRGRSLRGEQRTRRGDASGGPDSRHSAAHRTQRARADRGSIERTRGAGRGARSHGRVAAGTARGAHRPRFRHRCAGTRARSGSDSLGFPPGDGVHGIEHRHQSAGRYVLRRHRARSVLPMPIGQALVVEMGGEPVIVEERDRAAYAEAIETATTFSSAIVDQATGILSSIGIASPGRVLAPLVRSSVENALQRAAGPDDAFGLGLDPGL